MRRRRRIAAAVSATEARTPQALRSGTGGGEVICEVVPAEPGDWSRFRWATQVVANGWVRPRPQ